MTPPTATAVTTPPRIQLRDASQQKRTGDQCEADDDPAHQHGQQVGRRRAQQVAVLCAVGRCLREHAAQFAGAGDNGRDHCDGDGQGRVGRVGTGGPGHDR
jgi:hypothetical protein